MISVNWGTYIWGVNSGQVVETSLGYFINPLITVLLGVFLLRETLRRPQWCAVGIASIAIVVLAVDYGRLPWIALVLATSFAMYGYFKKRASVGAAESLAVETGFLALPALTSCWCCRHKARWSSARRRRQDRAARHDGRRDRDSTAVLRRRHSPPSLSTIGLLQYLTPVLQFGVGVGIDHEPMPPVRWVGFTLVWIALIILDRRRDTAPATARSGRARRSRNAAPLGPGLPHDEQAGRMAPCGCSWRSGRQPRRSRISRRRSRRCT